MMREMARDVLTKHWDGELPVNLEVIADRLSVSIEGKDNITHSGQYINDVISFNTQQSLTQQRFSIAHQLGHHVLGYKSCAEETPLTFSTSAHNLKEVLANQFALSLLIPTKHLRFAVLKKGKTDLKELADIFGVSTVAMNERLKHVFRL